MKTMVRRSPSVILFLLLGLSCAFGQQRTARADSLTYEPDAERLFQEGLQYFEAGRLDHARDTFVQIVNKYPDSHRVTAAALMAAKSEYRLGALDESIRLLQAFLERFDRSSFRANAHYTLGLNYYEQRRYDRAVGEFLESFNSTRDVEERGRSYQLIRTTASKHLTVNELQPFLARATHDSIRAMLQVTLAEKYVRAGDEHRARLLLEPIVRSSTSGSARRDAESLLERIRTGDMVTIGIVLPLQKELESRGANVGEEFLSGAVLAVEEHNDRALPKVRLEVRDSGRDSTGAAKMVDELGANRDVAAILGPVRSGEASLAALRAVQYGVPLISPTAVANGIASTGPHVFQANPDVETRARAMAQFATARLGARTFAILAPTDTVVKTQVQAFINQIMETGAELVDLQWYDLGTTDLRAQLASIRKKAYERMDPFVIDFTPKFRLVDLQRTVKHGVPHNLIDSLLRARGYISVRQLFGPDGKRIADSLRIPTLNLRAKVDSLSYPVLSIDAFFLPIVTAEEIGVVSPQLRYFNFRSALLGNDVWNDIGELEQHRQYTNGVYFPSDSYWNDADETYRDFVQRYQARFGQEPSRNTLYMYDSMRALLKVVGEGARSRGEIAKALSALQGFGGVHGKISFTRSRVNSYLSILRYRTRAISRIGMQDVVTQQFEPDQ